jgi:hypothetical protein
MAAKKRTKKKQTKSKQTAAKKGPTRKTAKKNLPAKRGVPKKKVAKKGVQRKGTAKAKVVGSKALGQKTVGATMVKRLEKPVRKKGRTLDEVAFPPETAQPRSGGQSGDLQGLSDVEGSDSESVDELVEEGNAFEADVVAGVEDAGDTEEREVRTHEVPEDDVPDEYKDDE